MISPFHYIFLMLESESFYRLCDLTIKVIAGIAVVYYLNRKGAKEKIREKILDHFVLTVEHVQHMLRLCRPRLLIYTYELIIIHAIADATDPQILWLKNELTRKQKGIDDFRKPYNCFRNEILTLELLLGIKIKDNVAKEIWGRIYDSYNITQPQQVVMAMNKLDTAQLVLEVLDSKLAGHITNQEAEHEIDLIVSRVEIEMRQTLLAFEDDLENLLILIRNHIEDY